MDGLIEVDTTDLLADALHHHRQGGLARAAALYTQALARDPAHPLALYLGGMASLQRGTAEAPDLLARAVAARPDHLLARLALAEALLRADDATGALAAADAALGLAPGDARGWFLRGTALGQLGKNADSIAALRACLAADPNHADARLNLANALVAADDLAAAEPLLRAALAMRPEMAEGWASLAHLLIMAGRPGKAIEAGDRAIALRPDLAVAHWNTGIACLLAGDWARGWDEYEWRKRHPLHQRDFRRLPGPQWRGETLAGKRILVVAEQGFGDAIQFARYLPVLRAAGARPVLACAPALIPLLSPLAQCVTLRDVTPGGVTPGDSLPEYDQWVDQMTLPRCFGTTVENVPAAAGYLRADPALVAHWQRLLPPGKRIGLVWAGNPAHHNDSRRSLPRRFLADLRPPPGTQLISLQLGPRGAEIADLPGAWDAAAHLTDWAQTAAALACLDLLICVDTAVAHLAGALGRPAWVLLPYAPCWRWLMGRTDTPWYDNVRLFRQDRPGAWAGVIAAVQHTLAVLPNAQSCLSDTGRKQT